MELYNIDKLIEKYFLGETSIAEEKELTNYFSQPTVAQHLEQYQPIFGYFSLAKEQTFKQIIPLKKLKRNVSWVAIAASIVVLLGIATYGYFNNEIVKGNKNQSLGTYEDPKKAFLETQKALALLSIQVNVGIESVQYVQEYDNSKEKIFNQ